MNESLVEVITLPLATMKHQEVVWFQNRSNWGTITIKERGLAWKDPDIGRSSSYIQSGTFSTDVLDLETRCGHPFPTTTGLG